MTLKGIEVTLGSPQMASIFVFPTTTSTRSDAISDGAIHPRRPGELALGNTKKKKGGAQEQLGKGGTVIEAGEGEEETGRAIVERRKDRVPEAIEAGRCRLPETRSPRDR